jgi:hypothetical protein
MKNTFISIKPMQFQQTIYKIEQQSITNIQQQVIPQMEVDNDYKERYAKILEEYDPENGY